MHSPDEEGHADTCCHTDGCGGHRATCRKQSQKDKRCGFHVPEDGRSTRGPLLTAGRERTQQESEGGHRRGGPRVTRGHTARQLPHMLFFSLFYFLRVCPCETDITANSRAGRHGGDSHAPRETRPRGPRGRRQRQLRRPGDQLYFLSFPFHYFLYLPSQQWHFWVKGVGRV